MVPVGARAAGWGGCGVLIWRKGVLVLTMFGGGVGGRVWAGAGGRKGAGVDLGRSLWNSVIDRGCKFDVGLLSLAINVLAHAGIRVSGGKLEGGVA